MLIVTVCAGSSGVSKYLPSVSCGPVDNSRAKKSFNWRPTPLRDALQITCDFFDNAWYTYPRETSQVLCGFMEEQRLLLQEAYKELSNSNVEASDII